MSTFWKKNSSVVNQNNFPTLSVGLCSFWVKLVRAIFCVSLSPPEFKAAFQKETEMDTDISLNNLRYDTTLMAESEEELKSLLMKVKEESWLKVQHSGNEDHGIWSHHFMGNRWGNSGNSVRFYFFWVPKSLQIVTVAMKLKDAYSLEGKLWPTYTTY